MKDKIIVIGFSIVLACFFLISLFDRDISTSKSERRTLKTFPTFTTQSVLDGTFSNELNTYTLDQFPFREYIRQGKSFITKNIYQKKESHGAFIVGNNIYELDYKISENSITNFTNKLKKIKEEYFEEKNVYYAIIPDKNYYAPTSLFPKLDYDTFYKKIRKQLPSSFHEIDLRSSLSLNSYYRTDLHWKQETLEPVLKIIQKEMNLEPTLFPTLTNTYFPFYGAYYSKAPTVKADAITYLTSDTIQKTKVYNYEKKEFQPVYKKENINNIDSYDIFLDGATSVLILENEKQKEKKELIIFRDSFASSLAPVLLENYSKIILIDLRYFSSNLLATIPELDFKKEAQDILFLYSVPIVNQSFTLK